MKHSSEIIVLALVTGIGLAAWYINYRYYRHIKPVYKIWITVASGVVVTGMLFLDYLYLDMPLKNVVIFALFWIFVLAYQIKAVRYQATIKSLQERIKQLQGGTGA